jgi:hypothetical protein
MNDNERAKDRFTLREEAITITVLPQCCRCQLNINRTECKQFKDKPVELMKNEQICRYSIAKE